MSLTPSVIAALIIMSGSFPNGANSTLLSRYQPTLLDITPTFVEASAAVGSGGGTGQE